MDRAVHTRWASLLAVYAVSGVGVGVGLNALHETGAIMVGVRVAAIVVIVGTACLLLVRLPGHGVTRVLTVIGLATATGPWLGVLADRLNGPVADRVLDALSGIVWTGEVPALALLVLLFPTGHPPGPRWRPVLFAVLGALGLLVVLAVVVDSASPVTPLVGAPAAVVLLAATAAAVWSLVLRWRRGGADERAGMRGFVVLAVLLVAFYLVSSTSILLDSPIPIPAADVAFSVVSAGLPAAVGYGVLRHRLYDIDVVLRRAAVWGLLSAVLLAVYLAVAVGVDALFGVRRGIDLRSLVPAVVVALALAPLRRLLQIGLDRLLYGRRGDPAAVLRLAGRQLSAAGAVADVPQRLAELVTSSLRLPWAAVELDREGRWERVAQSGAPDTGAVAVIAMTTAGEAPAQLLVTPRRGERTLPLRDRRLLDDLAVAVAPVLLSVRLVDELERSRERLLATRIEERQRLRHDLHDTMSPALGGMRLALDAARRLLPTEPERADLLLAAVLDETERTGEAVHRMLARLRPAPIGGATLLDAVTAHGELLAERADLQVVVGADSALPELPGAVTEAAYRIAVEAMTNTARHAAARRCTVRLSATEDLTVEVCDDGRGLPEPLRPGVGCESMRRRAADIGGRCEITTAAGGGTRVLAVLPLAVRA